MRSLWLTGIDTAFAPAGFAQGALLGFEDLDATAISSHWKDINLTGSKIGLMDPVLGSGEVLDPGPFDRMGCEIDMTLVPEAVPSTWACMPLADVAVCYRRR